ncbi:GNAT family N-acetyltransferase [Sneathiella limimaris]|uniref:GNAT family N-acetyltransferase n=1 Tax=Sneathiella limimaris TaxID=1964213 RepID=UPI001469B826|nr:GNAT family N-acetyltransferase [Sneathiella limimaris]
MTNTLIRPAQIEDTPRLNAALRALSEHMGDPHRITDETLEQALFSSPPSARAIIAEQDQEVVGAVLYSPFVSTTKGGIGLYVSDLWVSEKMRRQGLGPKLMDAAVNSETQEIKMIRLAVYDSNPAALKTYLRLGFKAETEAKTMILLREDFSNIRGKNESRI